MTHKQFKFKFNLLQHQCTEMPPSKSKKKNKTSTFRQEAHKPDEYQPRRPQEKTKDLILSAQDQTNVINVVTPNTEKGLAVQQAISSLIFVINLVTSVACATRRQITKGPWIHPRHIN